jgi:hypothetical protein
MSILSSLFSSGTRDINKSARLAENKLGTAYERALDAMRQGQGVMGAGYDQALGTLGGAGEQARGDLGQGFDAARADLLGGYSGAEDAIAAGRDTANDRLNPWVTSGQGAQGLYDQALGVEGPEAASQFVQSYASDDPFRNFRDEQANRQLASQFNARGAFSGGGEGGGSGRFGMAVSRASLERGTQDYQTYLDRLERAGARGAQYAGQQGQNDMSAGSQIGSLRTQGGRDLASNATGRGSALADLGLRVAGGQAGLQTGKASALAGNNNNIANLEYGYGQQLASNEINRGNATRQARAAPGQNLINLAGTAARFVPGGSVLSGLFGGSGGGYNPGSMSGLGSALSTGNYGNVGQSSVGLGGLPQLGGLFPRR